MKIHQYISLIIIVISFLVSDSASAVELSVLQRECAEIGFKIKTEDNGKCVLQLMDKLNSKTIKQETVINDVNAAQQRTIERQKQYEKDAEIAQKQREIDEFKRQQAEMYEQQRRSYAAQEAAANAQREAIDNDRQARAWSAVGESLQRQYGTGAYAPQPPPLPTPRAPITCNSFGQTTTCY